MSYNFKKINELELINEVPEGANVLIEADGATKRLPSTAIKSNDSYSKEESDTRYLTKDSIATPDLSQNDPTAADYIKNRPFYKEIKTVEILSNYTSTDYNSDEPKPVCTIVLGQKYNVVWNGELYENIICVDLDGYHTIGDRSIHPFAIDDDGGNGLYITTDDAEYTVSISTAQEVVHKLDAVYLPDEARSDWNQNDASAVNYIENRPFYEIPVETIVVVDHTFADGELLEEDDGRKMYGNYFDKSAIMLEDALIEHETYNVTIDGEAHTLVAFDNGRYIELRSPYGEGHYNICDIGDQLSFTRCDIKPTTLKIEISNNKIISDVEFNATEYNGEDYRSTYNLRMYAPLVPDGVYEVIYDGTTYNNVYVQEDSGYLVLGKDQNIGVLIMHQQDNFEYCAVFATETQGEHTCKIIHIFEAEVKKIDEKFIPDTIARTSDLPEQVQADFTQNDPTAANYIKNRPFYEIEAVLGDVVISEKTFSDEDYISADYDAVTAYTVQVPFERTHGYDTAWEDPNELEKELFNVTIDGVVYPNLTYTHVYSSYGYIGSSSPSTETEYPFIICTPYGVSGVWHIAFITGGEHTVQVTAVVAPGEIKQIDEKFIPDTIARTSDLPEQVQADFTQNDPTAVDYIKNRPFYEIPAETTIVVDYTFAEGELEVEGIEEGVNLYTKTFDNASEIMSEALIIGETYNVIIDGTVYTLNAAENYVYVNLEAKDKYDYAFSISTQNTEVFAVTFKGAIQPTTLKIEKAGAPGEIKQIDEKFIPDTIARTSEQVQADLSQNDSTAPDYVKGRTHWVEEGVLFDGSITLEDHGDEYSCSDMQYEPINIKLFEGETYVVTFDGTVFECVATDDGYGRIYIGDYVIWSGEGTPTLPFTYGDGWFVARPGTHTVTIRGNIMNKIDKKFLPDNLCYVTTFFFSGDNYLYKDINCEQKVSYAELYRANAQGAIMLRSDIGATALAAFVAFDPDNNYGWVSYLDNYPDGNLNPITIYTAEHAIEK